MGLQGVYQGELTGIFDETTASAVSAFQEKYSTDILSSYYLTSGTGYFGKGTRVKMNQLYGCKTTEPPQPITPSLSIEPNSAGRQLYIGETATFYATLKNASSSSPVYSYLKRPDGSMEVNGRYEGYTDTSGYLSKKEVYKIDAGYARVGTYKAWVNVGGKDSNIVELSVATANRPPVISGVGGPTSLKVNETGTWTVNAYDPDGTYLYYGIDWGDYGAKLTPTKKTASVNAGSPEATFTHSYAAAGTYKITFTISDAQGATAQTTLTVSVRDSSITVISPNEGKQLSLGNTFKIEWCANNFPSTAPGGYSYLYLLRGGEEYGLIYKDTLGGITACPGVGFYNWTVGNLTDIIKPAPIGGNYQIRVKFITQAGEIYTQGVSPKYFSIVGSTTPSITVLSPNGGENLSFGTSFEIKWKQTGLENTKIDILLKAYDKNFSPFANQYLIAGTVSPTQGFYSWTPSQKTLDDYFGYVVPRQYYKIIVRTIETPVPSAEIKDESDNYFSIVSSKTIQPPAPTTLQDIQNQLASIAQQILLLTERFKGTNR